MKISTVVSMIVLASLLIVSGCTQQSSEPRILADTNDEQTEQNEEQNMANRIAVMETNKGTIKIELYENKAPITTKNFIDLAQKGFYDGVIFHRVIPGFMIQGGDPDGRGTGGPGYTIKDEFYEGSSNVRGTISMANAGPNTGGSQFFINTVDNLPLDFDKQPLSSKHPVFGQVIEGMDVVDAIGNVQTGPGDKPVDDVVMTKVTIESQ